MPDFGMTYTIKTHCVHGPCTATLEYWSGMGPNKGGMLAKLKREGWRKIADYWYCPEHAALINERIKLARKKVSTVAV